MSHDKKKADLATLADEQDTFGNQSPYANTSTPYHVNQVIIPPVPVAPFSVPDEAPPMYTKDAPIQNEVFTPRDMPAPSPRSPHHQSSQPTFNPVSPIVPQSNIPQTSQLQNQQPQYQAPIQHPPLQNHIRQLEPQSSAPTIPAQPPVHHPQQYYPTPVNYGATPVGPNNNGYYPVPQHHDSSDSDSDERRPIRHRYRKKKKSKCSCCSCCCITILIIIFLCWYFGRISFGESTCHLTDDNPTFLATGRVSASKDLNFKFETLDGLTGNVLVQEADTVGSKDIEIRANFRASNTEFLNKLQLSKNVERDGSVRIQAHINNKYTEKEKNEMMKKSCGLVDVLIIYPRDQPSSGKLKLNIVNGQVYFMARPPSSSILGLDSDSKTESANLVVKTNSTHRENTITFEELSIKLINGPVTLEYVVVLSALDVSVANGYIIGSIDTPGKVSSDIINGSVDLAIDSRPRTYGWDPNKLKVTVNSINGRIYISFHRFLGHFSLSTTIGSKSIQQINSHDIVRYTSNTGYSTKGWVSTTDEEPINMSRLDLNSVNGIITAVIDGIE